jgi:hypothetical protein
LKFELPLVSFLLFLLLSSLLLLCTPTPLPPPPLLAHPPPPLLWRLLWLLLLLLWLLQLGQGGQGVLEEERGLTGSSVSRRTRVSGVDSRSNSSSGVIGRGGGGEARHGLRQDVRRCFPGRNTRGCCSRSDGAGHDGLAPEAEGVRLVVEEGGPGLEGAEVDHHLGRVAVRGVEGCLVVCFVLGGGVVGELREEMSPGMAKTRSDGRIGMA